MKRFNLITLIALVASMSFAADKIVKQERKGPVLIVTYESGSVTTNPLFLAMSPAVKNEILRVESEKMIIQTLKVVVDDTRSNIVETASLTDVQIAGLYMMQTKKRADDLKAIAPSNTIEFLMGAGIRQDLSAAPEAGEGGAK